jgi:hypothetical protein
VADPLAKEVGPMREIPSGPQKPIYPVLPIPTWRIAGSLSLVLLSLGLITMAVPAKADEAKHHAPDAAKKDVSQSEASSSRGDEEGADRLQTRPSPPLKALPKSPKQTSFMAAVGRLLKKEKTELKDLRLRFQQATDHATALAIQQKIELLKIQTELALLALQADLAREQGRKDVARVIEVAIDRIQRPRIEPARIERPGPRVAPQPAESR